MHPLARREFADDRDELYYNYYFFQTFRNIMKQMASTTRFARVTDIITESVARALGIKGSSLLLLDRRKKVLELVSSYGLSKRYISKGPIFPDKSISEAMDGIPVCVDDVLNDPRIQYPEEAEKEGITSLLSMPIMFKNSVTGLLRIYTSVPTEFSYQDIEFVQGLAELAGIVIEYNRLVQGYKNSLDAFKEHQKTIAGSQ